MYGVSMIIINIAFFSFSDSFVDLEMGTSKIRDKNKGGGDGKKKPAAELVPTLEDIKQIDGGSVELFENILKAACLTSQVEQIKSLFSTVDQSDRVK